MFLGLSYLNLDAKGRFAIPTKYREKILGDHAGQMILTADRGGKCLTLYPMLKWMETQQAIAELPNMNETVRDLKRIVIGYASEVQMDGQGRIMVTAPLRDFAGLDKKLILVGQIDTFELWSESSWSDGHENRIDSASNGIQQDESLKNFSI